MSVKKLILLAVLTFVIPTVSNLYSQQAENNILAAVGSKKITNSDFKKFLMNNFQSCGRIDTLSNANMELYLDSLINFTLILNEGKKNNLEEDPILVEKIKRFKNKVTVDKLIETQVIDSIITVEKLKSFYKNFGGELRLNQILIRVKGDSSEAASQIQNIYQKINNGLEFSEAAKEYSQDAMSSEMGGDIGFVRWGQLPQRIQDAAFSLNPGQVSQPIKTPFGFYLIQLVSKIKCGFNDEVRNLKYQMAAHYSKLIANARNSYLITLEKKYGLKLINSNIKKIAENVGPAYAPFESLSKNLFEIPLARYAEKSINLHDLINAVGNDDLTNYRWDEKSISKWISSIGMNKISILEAESLNINADEDIKSYGEYQIVNLMKNKIFDQNVSEEELRKFYDKNKSDFTFPDRVRVKYILVAEKFTAEKIFEMAKERKNFDELVNNYTLDALSRENNGDLGFISRQQFKEIYDVCGSLKIGEIGGPVAVPQGFAIVKLIGKEKSRIKNFDEAKNQMTSELLKNKKASAYNAFIKKLKKEFNITINQRIFSEFVKNPLGINLSSNSRKNNRDYAKTSN